QIRVRIIEGRQLPGNNIKPVVKVHICGQTHRTRIKRGNNPFFDEVSGVNTLAEVLRLPNVEKILTAYIKCHFVMDITGACSDVCFISGHAVMRKWLLLSDPEDTNSGAKGYMKVSMFVLGTGDEPPV
ncbi:MYOF protein, partial [Drymodes brunneopygia]|nr:MYOF protein [Drymodes brunneopygia]